jgi:hypothetical protein
MGCLDRLVDADKQGLQLVDAVEVADLRETGEGMRDRLEGAVSPVRR